MPTLYVDYDLGNIFLQSLKKINEKDKIALSLVSVLEE